MTYQDTLSWMFNQLPMYQNQGQTAYKANLDNTLLLASHLDHPERRFKSVHIAGTNGKGSTSHMIASVMQEAGYKVGLYTSPHLKDFRERIKINGKEIGEQAVIDFIGQHQSFFQSHHLSFFEMTVGMAFDYFAKENVDIAIIEVGMGGRLDSTNIISPELSVITNIGLDHTQFLGTTLDAIAREKGGIIKLNTPVVIGETQVETAAVFNQMAMSLTAPIFFADQCIETSLESGLKGSYQVKNIKTVLQAIEVLKTKDFVLEAEHIKKGLLDVIINTGLNGRWQVLQDHPKVICDTGHNREGLTYVVKQLQEETYNRLFIVFGVVNDKDLDSIFDLLPQNATYYFCKPNIPRGLDENILKNKFLNKGFIGESYSSVNEALKQAKNDAFQDDLIFIGGSTFVVSEII